MTNPQLPPTRRRRIVSRSVLALAVVALLVSGYVGAWLAVSRAARDGLIDKPVAKRIATVFSPIVSYCRAEQPGCELLSRLFWTVNPPVEFEFGGPLAFYASPVPQPMRPPFPVVEQVYGESEAIRRVRAVQEED